MRRLLIVCFLGTLVAVPGMAQKDAEVPVSHCTSNFVVDIGPNMEQPNGAIQTVSGDTTADGDSEDYFDITCLQGDTLFMTYCSDGGTADFDTSLSTWSGAGFTNQEGCNDDTCGLLSELSLVFPSTGMFRVRLGSFGSGTGAYTLAYSAPVGCSIEGAIPVELESFEVSEAELPALTPVGHAPARSPRSQNCGSTPAASGH